MEKHVPWQNHSVIAKFRIRFKRIKEKKNQKLPPLAKFAEAATRGVLWKKVFFEISQNSQENTGARASGLQLYLIRDFGQVIYCEFCKISKNTFFTEDPWTTAFEFVTEMLIFRSSRSQMFFKISVFKNFAILEPLSYNKVTDFFYRTPRVAASEFLWQQIHLCIWI